MSRLTKKRATFTLADYKEAKTKRSKPNEIHSVVGTNTKTNSSSILSNEPPNLSSNVDDIVPSSNHYTITKPQHGIDMCTFRLSSFTSHQIRTNISAIIRKTQNYKFIELVPSKPNKIPRSNRNTRNNPCRINRAIINQPKISSFFNNNNINTTSVPSVHTSIVSLLHNKSRLVVEDFMELKESTHVVLLVPQLEKQQPPSLRSILRNNKEYNIVQFGTKSSTKYHLIPAYVKSNPYYTKLQFNLMQITEVTSAFCEKRNNGYGVSFNLCLDSTFNVGSSKLSTSCFELQWIDVLKGLSLGIQVWAELEYCRDYSYLFKSKFNSSTIGDSQLALLSFIYDEICFDLPAVFNLLSRYYHEQSLSNKNEIERLSKKCSKMVTKQLYSCP